jgi:aminopeptidase N
MDWFFDEWLYKMGHPVFRVTQDYDATKKLLTLNVRQEQRPDPESQYPQVAFFQTPVDIEIGTASNKRIERVQIEPKEEQTFKFSVDSEPLLVNFDYGSTLIKELVFVKTTGQLLYQLRNDDDVLGRIWATSQLASRMNEEKTSATDRESIVKAFGERATEDQFWGARFEVVAMLNGKKEARDALLAAAKDGDARVRARAVTSLAATKDPSLADAYTQLLNDRSYAVIRAAAIALGQTQNSTAYDSLIKLIDAPSWRDTIRASGLSGLAALGDKRALDLGFKYYAAPNPSAVRLASLNLLGAAGKDDPRTLATLTAALSEGVERRNFGVMTAAGEALVLLGDQRALTTFQELTKKAGTSPQIIATLSGYEARLRSKAVAAKPGS